MRRTRIDPARASAIRSGPGSPARRTMTPAGLVLTPRSRAVRFPACCGHIAVHVSLMVCMQLICALIGESREGISGNLPVIFHIVFPSCNAFSPNTINIAPTRAPLGSALQLLGAGPAMLYTALRHSVARAPMFVPLQPVRANVGKVAEHLSRPYVFRDDFVEVAMPRWCRGISSKGRII